MGFALEVAHDHVLPVVRCDRCGGATLAGGFVLWDTDIDSETLGASLLIACDSECLDELIAQSSTPDTWVALPLDAYLANLVRALGIDIDVVLARERAALAAERTRSESPE